MVTVTDLGRHKSDYSDTYITRIEAPGYDPIYVELATFDLSWSNEAGGVRKSVAIDYIHASPWPDDLKAEAIKYFEHSND